MNTKLGLDALFHSRILLYTQFQGIQGKVGPHALAFTWHRAEPAGPD